MACSTAVENKPYKQEVVGMFLATGKAFLSPPSLTTDVPQNTLKHVRANEALRAIGKNVRHFHVKWILKPFCQLSKLIENLRAQHFSKKCNLTHEVSKPSKKSWLIK